MKTSRPRSWFLPRRNGFAALLFTLGVTCLPWLSAQTSRTGTWKNDGTNTNWTDTANWAEGVIAGTTTLNNSSIANFNTAVGTVGASGNPIIIDTAGWALKEIVFDTANVGPFFIGTTGGNALFLTSGGAITVNSAVTHTQTIDAPLVMQAGNGNFALINNAASGSTHLNIGGAITAAATTGTTSLTIGGSNTGANTLSGVIGNGPGSAVRLIKSGVGTWVLTGANTYTGATLLDSGTLALDFSAAGAPSSNIINSSSALTLGSTSGAVVNTLSIQGKASTATTQTLGAVTFSGVTSGGGGASHINLTAGAGGSLALNLGALATTKMGGAAIDFSLGVNTSVKTTTASNATTGLFVNVVTINGSDFATNNGNAANNLVGLGAIDQDGNYTGIGYDKTTAISASLTKALDVQGNTSITGSGSLNIPAIRFNQAAVNTLTIASGRTVAFTSSAILVTSNVGANTTTITGGTIRGGGRDLALIQNNVLGDLVINSAVNDNGTTALGLAKSGLGRAILSGANTALGPILVNEGTLQFAKQVSLYNNTSASWTSANIRVANAATLALNVGGTGEFTTSDVATIAATDFRAGAKLGLDTTNAAGGNFTHGTAIANTNAGANALILRKMGANTLTLSGANTYTGGTLIEQGKLALTQSFSMGSASANAITIANAAGTVAGTDYAQMVFSGTTLTYGGSLTLNLTGTITSTKVYDLIDYAAGSGSGNFSSVSIAGSYVSALTQSGSTWTGSASGVTFTFDTVSGDLTASVSSVPEPSSWALLMGGVTLTGVLMKRRRRTGC